MEASVVELSVSVLRLIVAIMHLYFRRFELKCKKRKVPVSLVGALHVASS